MEKHSDLAPAQRQQAIDRINQRWGQLYHLEKEWGERAINYLFLTNAGGAIATLSFLGASEVVLHMPAVKVALALFVVGVILVGITTAKQFHHMSNLFKKWKADANSYFGNQVTMQDINDRDRSRTGEDILDYVIPYASFSCFVAGCAFGGIALFCS